MSGTPAADDGENGWCRLEDSSTGLVSGKKDKRSERDDKPVQTVRTLPGRRVGHPDIGNDRAYDRLTSALKHKLNTGLLFLFDLHMCRGRRGPPEFGYWSPHRALGEVVGIL